MEKGMEIPERFRQLRMLAGLTLHDVERQTGVNASWLCQFELGRYQLSPKHQKIVFALLLQAVEIRGAIIEKVLGDRKIDEPALAGARGRGS